VLEEYRELKHANPAFEPARPVLPAKVRPGERDQDTPLIDDPLSARCVDLFNVGYEVLLQTLERFFAHTEETDAELATLAEVTIALMVRVLKPLGSLITTLPVGLAHPGRTAGPSFELFYETDYLMPHREAAWALLEERLRESADFCTRTADDCDSDLAARLEPVRSAINDIADMLGAHREPGDVRASASAAPAAKKVEVLLARASELTGEGWTADAPGLGDAAWARAQELTERMAAAPADLALAETAACLQQLATLLCRPDEVEARVARLRELQSGLEPGIRVARDGPYLLTGPARVRDWLGEPVDITPQTALCRCGASAIKPFCDGSHERVGFSGAKSPDRVPDNRDSYEGVQLTVYDNRGICQHSGFCTDRLNTVFRTDQEPFVAASGGRMDEIIRAVRECPSGALSYAIDGVEARAEVDHHGQRDAAIEVSRDGPYRVTGGLALLDEEGRDVDRAEGASREHFALCRCGNSQNKPFCSGMHWYVDFHDPVPDPDQVPSVFEWAGGLPALRRMTRRFYETHVPADPLLAPLFAGMAADHPERVASWLAEVFGGPERYSERYGGYERMLSQHLGRGISEEQRARWVELLMRSAREAGLPDDPEFSAAFRSYIEWGSHLALQNSQPGARPPEHMPMPRWDWSTAAGPPGARPDPSAGEPAAAEPTLPGADEPVSFERHIKTLFRAGDRRSMQFAFDLWSYQDVRTHAEAILAQVKAGTMPCDGAWPPEWVAALARWVESGMAA
jgi:CDGSH-type Zn-finger protein/truncated hemoglobin YjbI